MKTVTVDGVNLNVLDVGQGPVILLAHGFPLDHSMWQGQIDALADTYRLVVPDLRGFGASDVTVGTVTMGQLADDVNGILNHLGIREPVVFGGLSMGGYVAWQFYRKYRERVRAMILCDTRAMADSPEAAHNRHQLVQATLRHGPAAVAQPMQAKLFAAETMSRKPKFVEAMLTVMSNTSTEGMAAALRGMAERADARSLLPEIDVPVLLMAGTEDSISTPQEMREIAAAIKNSRFVEVPHAGHMAPLENPSVVNAAIREFVQ